MYIKNFINIQEAGAQTYKYTGRSSAPFHVDQNQLIQLGQSKVYIVFIQILAALK